MAKSLRNYPPGVRTALIALSGGTCYYPDCREPVVRFVSGRPIPHLEVAHIAASSDDGPRGDHRVDPADRDLFENLILLCDEHHKLVDDRKLWRQYPKEMLREWKNDREEGARDTLAGLREISPAKLQELVSEAVTARDENLEDLARRLSGVDAESAASIRAVLEELKRRRQALDPDTVSIFSKAVKELRGSGLDPDTVSKAVKELRGLSGTLDAFVAAARTSKRRSPD